ncbi:MAG: peptidase s8 and s53 in kexin sedolisin [Acidimicrobiales bacterium]|nr:peptidase s8 and s53 in kexin sedolisin [Acidimicrobiales bacterium]
MRARRICIVLATAAVIAAGLAGATGPAGARPARPPAPDRLAAPPATSYVVLATGSRQIPAARHAVTAAGGTVVAVDEAIGTLTVSAPGGGFLGAVRGQPGIAGAARDRAIAASPGVTPKRDLVEGVKDLAGRAQAPPAEADRSARPVPRRPGHDTFERLQWDMKMIHADVARRTNPGTHDVLVGIMDTGIDASHPDLSPNFDRVRSRNFTTDIPQVDGPCEVSSCVDPDDVDDGAHGTHVAGSVAAAANGMGIVGVAPRVKLVNVRAGQDSGYFFLAPTLEALTYSADAGIDVVNMSFYVDPWLFNCRSNPADSPLAQYEQRSIVLAVNRALDYAHDHGVTLVSAAGNEDTDLGKPGMDASSPDFPLGAAYPRKIDNDDCLSMPAEGHHVLDVTSVGPSRRKADYSNYGLERVWVAAPGGWAGDVADDDPSGSGLILSSFPRHVLQEEGLVDPDGNIIPQARGSVLKDCDAAGICGYYTYLQGTSMASPHAVGVAALAVARYGRPDAERGGKTLDPDMTAIALAASANPQPCATPPPPGREEPVAVGSPDPRCEGSTRFNGFYGFGIVDAARMVGAHVAP